MENLLNLNKKELFMKCKEFRIKNYSNKNKKELIELINNFHSSKLINIQENNSLNERISNIEIIKTNKKTELGQFYTTNYNYILQNMDISEDVKKIIEPFAGNGDLLNFITNKEKYELECYDLDPKKDYIIKRDTLLNPPNYDDKFILTNPPYLARNKNKNKMLYDKYDCNDLYKCFLKNIISSNCKGGIIIIPLNFISSIRKNDIELRKSFIEKFNIIKMNIFEEQVFTDTSYTVCCIQFERNVSFNKIHEIKNTKCYIYPSNKIINILLDEKNNYTIGGEIYNLQKNKYKIERATKLTNMDNITNILLKCIDDNINNKIKLKIVNDEDRYIDETPNLSARSYATLIITPKISIEKQNELVIKFNEYLNLQRDKYNSLFLTNYRESNTIARKRISFELAFSICSYLLEF